MMNKSTSSLRTINPSFDMRHAGEQGRAVSLGDTALEINSARLTNGAPEFAINLSLLSRRVGGGV